MRRTRHARQCFTVSLAIAAFGVLTSAGELRTWTDRTGKHNVEAELESFEDGNVTLRKQDGNTVTLPVERLSEADQRFIRQQSSARSKRPVWQDVTHDFDNGSVPTTANTSTTQANDDRFTVPDGGPNELLSFIQQLRQTPVPQGQSRAELVDLQKRLFAAILQAADKILQGDASPDQKKSAAEHQLVALRVLSQLGVAGMSGRLQRLPEELEGRGLRELASTARTAALVVQMGSVRGMTAHDVKELLAKVARHLKDQPLGRDEVQLAMSAGRLAEQLGPDVAVQTYRELGELLSESDDPALASNGKVMQGAARRLDLLGKEMSLEGVTMDGVPFDLKDQRGKVVLVDFWATWCGPCMQEMPNIRQNYDRYRGRGFNVVAVSVDRDLNSLKQYVAREAPPWIILADNHPSVQRDQSMSTYYGIFGIPTTILVGPDGNVVSLNCRGPRLGAELERLLGPAS